MKFTNQKAAASGNAAKAKPRLIKQPPVVEYEERDYYPVMIELGHLLEKTHAVAYEEEIIRKIQELEEADPKSRSDNGILWQTLGEDLNLLFDERTLRVYQAVFETYLDPALLKNLGDFLEETNRKRRAAFESADGSEKDQFKKINVVTLN